ncbi:hypothetical protein ACFY91_24515 [Streptomyces albogriseolus]|uniref:hypothetical protein n=1 Tax=Streptomyces albogriseolus TaxID=1887 RepID=UPI0036EFDDD5
MPTPPLFTSRQALDRELTVTGTWKALHTAVHASTPRLTSHSHPNPGGEPVTGLRFIEDVPHTGQARTRGTVIVTPDGHLTIRAYTIPGRRWLTALRHLGTLDAQSLLPGADTTPADPTTPAWSLRPQVKNRSVCGQLRPSEHVQATTLTELPNTLGDTTAQLTLAPDSRAACQAAWQTAASFFYMLTTGTRRPDQTPTA